MAEIVPVVSETLEAQIRDLLPSQRGFGEDLQASNVITPIIDLTATAQGTSTPQYMQTALAFGSQTAFEANNSTDVVASSPGFYRIFGTSTLKTDGSNTRANSFTMTDGLSVKTVWKHVQVSSGTAYAISEEVDFVVFLAAGESISAESQDTEGFLTGSSRQVADVNGNLVNPSGFTPQ